MANPFDSTVQQHVSVRPLNKGMTQSLPSNGLPEGGFWRIQNYRVETQGLKRRGGYTDFNQNTGVGANSVDEKMYDIIYFYQRSGDAEQLLLTAEKLYLMYPNGNNIEFSYKNVDDTIISNTTTVDGFFDVVLPSTASAVARIRPWDYLTIDGVQYEVESALFSTNATITLKGAVTAGDFTGSALILKERFRTEDGLGPSYAVLPSVSNATEDKVLIADQSARGLYQYTGGGQIAPFVIDSKTGTGPDTEYVVGAKTITYFDDRIWIGNTEEIDGEFRQRIRWSDAVNFDRIAPASYVDLPYTEGQLLKLVPLGSILVAYFEDAIYLGRRTNMAGQPYFFERLESGHVGLLNARAVVRHIDTHYFVGTDNIYALAGTTGFQPIGDAVLTEALHFTRSLGLLQEIQVEHDPVSDSIVFLFPDRIEGSYVKLTSIASRLWRFYYKTNAWAYDEVNYLDAEKTAPQFLYTGILPSNTYIFGRTWQEWEDLTGSDVPPFNASWDGTADPAAPNYPGLPDEAFGDFESWDALGSSEKLGTTLKIAMLSAPLSKEVIVEEQRLADQDTVGGIEYPIWALIESGDFDYGLPDYTKTVTRLSVKSMHVYSERESSLVEVGGVFDLEISDAMGYHWKRPMTLRFKRNYNEGYANFRSTGSTFRFKLINSQVIAPYRISEYIMRIVGRGLQVEN